MQALGPASLLLLLSSASSSSPSSTAAAAATAMRRRRIDAELRLILFMIYTGSFADS
jgi:hypothetical protein